VEELHLIDYQLDDFFVFFYKKLKTPQPRSSSTAKYCTKYL